MVKIRITKSQEVREMTPSELRNLDKINAALDERGPDYRIVRILVDKLLKKNMTAGPAAVRKLIDIVREDKADKKTKKLAIKGLLKLHPKGLVPFEKNIERMTFQKDFDLTFGTLLILAKANPNNEMVFQWMTDNMDRYDVWWTALVNLISTDLIYQDEAYGAKKMPFGSVDLIMNKSNTTFWLKALTDRNWSSPILTVLGEENPMMLIQIMKKIAEQTNAKTLENAVDISRALAAWSSQCSEPVNAKIAKVFKALNMHFYPGCITLDTIDQKIYEVVLENELNEYNYSMKKYLTNMNLLPRAIDFGLKLEKGIAVSNPESMINSINDMIYEYKTLVSNDLTEEEFQEEYGLVFAI